MLHLKYELHKKFHMTFLVIGDEMAGKCCENVVRYFYWLVYDFLIMPKRLIHNNNKAIAVMRISRANILRALAMNAF